MREESFADGNIEKSIQVASEDYADMDLSRF